MRNIRKLLEKHLIVVIIPGRGLKYMVNISCVGQEVPVYNRKTKKQVLSFEVPAPTVHPEPNLLKPVSHAPSPRWVAKEK